MVKTCKTGIKNRDSDVQGVQVGPQSRYKAKASETVSTLPKHEQGLNQKVSDSEHYNLESERKASVYY